MAYIPSKPLQLSLIFLSKAKAVPNKALLICYILVQGPSLTRKYYTGLDKITRDKHSSFFSLFVSDDKIYFTALTDGVSVINLHFFCHIIDWAK